VATKLLQYLASTASVWVGSFPPTPLLDEILNAHNHIRSITTVLWLIRWVCTWEH